MAAGMAPNFLTSEFLHQGEYGFVLGSEEQPQQCLGSARDLENHSIGS